MAQWAEIIPKVLAAMDRGVDPSDPEVHALGRRWKSLVNAFTGGDDGMARSVMNVYKEEGPALREQMSSVPSPEMFAYMGKVFAALARQG